MTDFSGVLMRVLRKNGAGACACLMMILGGHWLRVGRLDWIDVATGLLCFAAVLGVMSLLAWRRLSRRDGAAAAAPGGKAR